MKIVRKNDAEIFKDGEIFVAHEYDTQNHNINIARIEINGRYPVQGSMRNTKVSEIVYIEKGTGEVSINGTQIKVNAGDVISFDSGERIFWNGNFVLVIACAPAWSKEQHEYLP